MSAEQEMYDAWSVTTVELGEEYADRLAGNIVKGPFSYRGQTASGAKFVYEEDPNLEVHLSDEHADIRAKDEPVQCDELYNWTRGRPQSTTNLLE